MVHLVLIARQGMRQPEPRVWSLATVLPIKKKNPLCKQLTIKPIHSFSSLSSGQPSVSVKWFLYMSQAIQFCALQLWPKRIPRQYVNKGVQLCANKTLFIKKTSQGPDLEVSQWVWRTPGVFLFQKPVWRKRAGKCIKCVCDGRIWETRGKKKGTNSMGRRNKVERLL